MSAATVTRRTRAPLAGALALGLTLGATHVQAADPLPSWNDGKAKQSILGFVANPAAPPHPFMPGLYTPRYEQEIRDALAEAEQADERSRADGHRASSYLGYTVTFATVLFFASTAGKFDHRRVRLWSLVFAITLFLYSVVGMFRLPVA